MDRGRRKALGSRQKAVGRRQQAVGGTQYAVNDSQDMLETCNKASGLTQDTDKQLVNASGRDGSRIDGLVEQAGKGAFDAKICLAFEGKLMCRYIPEDPAASVVDQLERSRKGSRGPSTDVNAATKHLTV